MTKAEADRKLYKIYHMLKTIGIKPEFDRELDAYGEMYDDGSMILNPQKRGLPLTILHECLHRCYPDIKDDNVFLTWENEMFDNLSDRQLTNLVKRVFG